LAKPFDRALITAWLVSATPAEVARRLGRVMTPGEVVATIRRLRLGGLDLAPRPGGLGGGNPFTLTPHPGGKDLWLDGLGRTAGRVGPEAPAKPGRHPKERVRRCAICDRLASGGWAIVIGVRRRFVCNRHVTAVG
jgi:hypothetical protein